MSSKTIFLFVFKRKSHVFLTSSYRFFNNRGAVAGVFAIVGLVGLVLLIALLTNAVRRRRAKKFDEEVAAAAAEAAASSRYPFDDFDDAPAGGYGAGGGGNNGGSGGANLNRAGTAYSDPESQHGAYSQPPMPLNDSYNMTEYSRYGPAAGYGTGAAATVGMAAGAAGMRHRNDTGEFGANNNIAGFGTSTARSGSPPNPNVPAPYNTFAVPGGPAPGEMYDPTPALQRRATNSRAASLGIGVGENPFEASPVAVGGAYLNRGPSQNQQTGLARQPSQPSSGYTDYNSGYSQGQSATVVASSHGHESYTAHYQPDFRPDTHTYNGGSLTPAPELPNPHSPARTPTPKKDSSQEDAPLGDDEAYGADSYYPVKPSGPQGNDNRMSLRDEVDYGQQPRTLKVCRHVSPISSRFHYHVELTTCALHAQTLNIHRLQMNEISFHNLANPLHSAVHKMSSVLIKCSLIASPYYNSL